MITWKKTGDSYTGTGKIIYRITRAKRGGENGFVVKSDGRYPNYFGTLKVAKAYAESVDKTLSKRSNPVSTSVAVVKAKQAADSIAQKIAAAKKLRAGFRYTAGGRKNQKSTVKEATEKTDAVRVIIGRVDAVEYTVLSDDGRPLKNQSFRHEFTGKSCPQLAAGSDGTQLYFVGGRYQFRTDGINDL